MRRLIALPTTYLDTSLVAAAAVKGTLHHQAALDRCNDLILAGTTVCFSRLLYVEMLQTLRAIGTQPHAVSEQLRRRYRLHRWGDFEAVRETWLRFGFHEVDELVRRFSATVVLPLDDAIVDRALTMMARYQLGSNDAIHSASAVAAGVLAFATLDADFARVAELTVHLVRDT